MAQRNSKVLGCHIVSATPLLFQICALSHEDFLNLFNGAGDEVVRVLNGFSRFVNEIGLNAGPTVAQFLHLALRKKRGGRTGAFEWNNFRLSVNGASFR